MSKAQIIFLQITTVVTAITGIVFAWMKYFMKSDDPFAVANHPWQPHVLAIHVVVAPLLVFALGWIFHNHILTKILGNGGKRRRSTGILAMILILPMILSAYLMQAFTVGILHEAMKITHWVSSGLFVLIYLAHFPGKKRNGNGKNGNGRNGNGRAR